MTTEQPNNTPTILVTGATGLVGAHLLYHLVSSPTSVIWTRSGHPDLSGPEKPGASRYSHQASPQSTNSPIHHLSPRIIALKRSTSNLDEVKKVFSYYPLADETLFDRIEWRTADILDKESLIKALDGVDQVYHCAAIVSFDPAERKKLIENNVVGTKNLVEAIQTISGGPHLHGDDSSKVTLVHVSSTSALGDAPGTDAEFLVDEDTPRDPKRSHSGYSVSKFESEKIVHEAIAKGLKAAIVNPGIILGPGFWDKGSSMLVTKVAEGLKFYTKGGTGYVDVRDVCEVMVGLMGGLRKMPAGPRLRGNDNRASQDSKEVDRYCLVGFNAYYKDLFFAIADSLGVKRPSVRAGRLLSEIAWRVDTLRSRLLGKYPLITRETAESAQRVSFYSAGKLMGGSGEAGNEGNWRGFRSMDETVEWVCKYY